MPSGCCIMLIFIRFHEKFCHVNLQELKDHEERKEAGRAIPRMHIYRGLYFEKRLAIGVDRIIA
jgi:hypothetical protein